MNFDLLSYLTLSQPQVWEIPSLICISTCAMISGYSP